MVGADCQGDAQASQQRGIFPDSQENPLVIPNPCGMAVPVSHLPLAPVLAQATSGAGGTLNKSLK